MNEFPMAIARQIREAIATVPHASCDTPRWHEMSVGNAHTMSVRVDGWGPTLHEAAYTDTRAFESKEALMAGAVDHAWTLAMRQRVNMEAANTAGLKKPAFAPTMNPDRGKQGLRNVTIHEIRHARLLHVHSVLADALVARLGPLGAYDVVVRDIETLRSAFQSEANFIKANGRRVRVADGIALLDPVVALGGAMLWGTDLTITPRIPDAIVDAMPGRAVGELVATGVPSLDAAIVLTATQSTLPPGVPANLGRQGPSLTIASPTVRIGDHPGLADGLALATARAPDQPPHALVRDDGVF